MYMYVDAGERRPDGGYISSHLDSPIPDQQIGGMLRT